MHNRLDRAALQTTLDVLMHPYPCASSQLCVLFRKLGMPILVVMRLMITFEGKVMPKLRTLEMPCWPLWSPKFHIYARN